MKKSFGYCEINNRGEGGGRGIIWYSRVFGVINYKSFSNSVFISLTRHHYHIPQICVTFFLCSDDTKNLQGISNPPPCCKSFEYRRFTLTIHLHFHTFTVLIEERPLLRPYLGTCSIVFPLLSLHAIAYLSCTREDISSSFMASQISPSLGCQES